MLVQPSAVILVMLNSAKTVLLLWLLNVILVLLVLLSMELFVNAIPVSIKMELFAQFVQSNVYFVQSTLHVLLALIMSPEILLIIVTAELVTLIVEVQFVLSVVIFVKLAQIVHLVKLVSLKTTEI